jgi:hypothetical protein
MHLTVSGLCIIHNNISVVCVRGLLADIGNGRFELRVCVCVVVVALCVRVVINQSRWSNRFGLKVFKQFTVVLLTWCLHMYGVVMCF